MVRDRFEHLDADKQERLFEAAADEFAAKGYERASLNRILARAGISKGSLYYYFEDKADLFSTVMERAVGQMFRLVGGFSLEELTAETYWAVLEGLFARLMTFLTGHGWYVKLARAYYRIRGSSAGGARTERLFDVARSWTRLILERGQELAVVRRDLPLPLMVETVLAFGEAGDRWLLEHWDEFPGEERERLVALEMDMFRRILAPVPAGGNA